jgi:vitamin B12 transporter
VPTYTDLYYIGPQAIGNENLQPEEAFSEEIGVKWITSRFDFAFAAFNRDSNDLIDYVRVDRNGFSLHATKYPRCKYKRI